MGIGVAARLTPVALRRWCTLIGVLCCGMFALSVNRAIGVAYTSDSLECYSVRLCAGELWLRWNRASPPGMRVFDCGLGLIAEAPGDCAFAWRPYHAQRTGCGTTDYEGLNIPLWQGAAGSLLLVAYAHGLIRGLRRVDRGRCHVCGVDLTGRAAGESCPSCGARPSIRAGLACRACGYDLGGLPVGWRGRRRCPECGATTLRPAR